MVQPFTPAEAQRLVDFKRDYEAAGRHAPLEVHELRRLRFWRWRVQQQHQAGLQRLAKRGLGRRS